MKLAANDAAVNIFYYIKLKEH